MNTPTNPAKHPSTPRKGSLAADIMEALSPKSAPEPEEEETLLKRYSKEVPSLRKRFAPKDSLRKWDKQ